MGNIVSKEKELIRGFSDIRSYFPIFQEYKNKPLAYLDTAASSQKPRQVIDRLSTYLSKEHANIHRGAYRLSAESTELYDDARRKVQKFVGASSEKEIIFTRGATESINLIAHTLEHNFKEGDVILLTLLEHHSNIVPWQLLAKRKGLRVEFADINDDASLNLEDFKKKVKDLKPKLISASWLSNAFGTVMPVKEIVEIAKEAKAWIVLDAAQAVVHERLQLSESGADYVVFSGHKMYGPTGIGVLYVNKNMYKFMEPFLGGGDMIERVTITGSTWAEPPEKFEAGTPAIGEAIALGAAIDFINSFRIEEISSHEKDIFNYGVSLLSKEPKVKIIGPITSGKKQSSIIAFTVDGAHPHDLATIADSFNVQIRAGHHCAQPALRRLDLNATARASTGIYTVKEDFDQLIESIRAAVKMLG